ncbi:MAG: YggS family pyridoxal phosphate-dependent enzyme [Fusobacteriaceae bacterium]
MNIEKNIEQILEDIEKYSPNPSAVKLLAVTKYVDTDTIQKLFDCGIKNIGENKGQVIRDKAKYFAEKKIDDICWHFIGSLQSNKIKYISEYISLIHSVNKISLAREIDKKAKECGRIISILLEINISGEESKEGYSYENLLEDLPEYFELKNIEIKGLMTMAPLTDDENILRKVFAGLREKKDELNKKYFSYQSDGKILTELSMGMSNDYKIALEEGATIIRIGTKLFE